MLMYHAGPEVTAALAQVVYSPSKFIYAIGTCIASARHGADFEIFLDKKAM
jgi:hypothetical protein